MELHTSFARVLWAVALLILSACGTKSYFFTADQSTQTACETPGSLGKAYTLTFRKRFLDKFSEKVFSSRLKKLTGGHHYSSARFVYELQDAATTEEGTFHVNLALEYEQSRLTVSCGAGQERFTLLENTLVPRKTYRLVLDLPKPCLTSKMATIELSVDRPQQMYMDLAEMRVLTVSPTVRIPNAHSIEGYADQLTYERGETVVVRAHVPKKKFDLRVLRYGNGMEPVLELDGLSGSPQSYPILASRDGADWSPTRSFDVRPTWKPGQYFAELKDSTHRSFVPFVVVPTNPTSVVVFSSQNTWQAYNDWGGSSHYVSEYEKCLGRFNFPIVSFLRPNPNADPTLIGPRGRENAQGEMKLIRWLEQKRINYSLYPDTYLNEHPDMLRTAQIVVLNTHPEYWSSIMLNALEKHLNDGGSLIYLGGNALWGKVVLSRHQIEYRHNGQKHELSNEQGGLWDVQQRSRILGISYESYPGNGNGTDAAYKVMGPQHWVFAGTLLRQGDQFGRPTPETPGASGDEMDRRTEFSGSNVALLAKGTNPNGKGAEMVYFQHPGGGHVFSVGSISFCQSLLSDKKVSRIVENVVERFQRVTRKRSMQARSTQGGLVDY